MEPEVITFKNEKVRLQLLDPSFKEQLEEFIATHFLPEESLARAAGFHNMNDPAVVEECRQVSKRYAALAIEAKPMASVIAVKESDKKLIGIRLASVTELKKLGEHNKETEGFENFILSIKVNLS